MDWLVKSVLVVWCDVFVEMQCGFEELGGAEQGELHTTDVEDDQLCCV